MTFSTGVIPSTRVSRPQLKSNPMEDRVLHNDKDHRRNVKLPKNKTFVLACNDSLNAKTLNVKSVSMCDKCVLHDKHDMCVLKSVAKPIKRTVASESNKKPRNFTRKIYEHISKTCSWWYPKSTPSGYIWKPKSRTESVNPNVSMPLGNRSRTANDLEPTTFRCSKHMTGNLKLLINFVEKFLGTGNDLLSGSRGTDLYSITLQDTNSPNPICLLVKVTSSQAWLWHRRLSHLNFDTINLLSKNDIVVGLPKVKFIKDHLCSSIKDRKGTGNAAADHLPRIENDELSDDSEVDDNFPGETLLIHDKMKEKGDECIFVRYSTKSRAYRVFNKRTRVIMESIHVNFDELPLIASDQLSSDPAPECQTMASDQNSSDPAPEYRIVTTSNELDLLFSPMFDELLNGSSKVVSKSSAASAADAPNQHQRQNHTTPLNNQTTPAPSCQILTLAPTVISFENINQAETHAENDQVADDEFINIFSTPVQDQGETSSCHVDSSNMHTFYQQFSSEHRWTKDHPLEQVIGNPSQPVRTRRKLESDDEMCMFALTVSRTEPKNIKEAMADSAWIESMQEELHQFDRLDV
nr:integrase, catalytic region, zinc finger, CCHC-type, peptidase aspartic, catalytic [Tanacetum cinerariifolium]